MNSRAEFEQEADGRRIAGIPDLPGVPAHGSGRDEALAYVQALARTGWTIKREIGPRMLASPSTRGSRPKTSSSRSDERLPGDAPIVPSWRGGAPPKPRTISHHQRSADMFPRFMYPFLVYRSFAFPILVLSLIVLPCWLAFRLYRLRTTEHPLSFPREILLLAAVLYLSGLVATTLTPNHNSRGRAESTVGIQLHPDLASLTCSSATLPEGSKARSFCVRNAAGNVMLFFPLGILIPLVWRRVRFWRGIQIAIALSITIELVQYLSRAWGSYRSADVNDVVLNGLGACLGLILVSLLRLRRGTSPAAPRA